MYEEENNSIKLNLVNEEGNKNLHLRYNRQIKEVYVAEKGKIICFLIAILFTLFFLIKASLKRCIFNC